MKLFEILEHAKLTKDIIVRKTPTRGCVARMRYFENFKAFMVVDSSGKLILPNEPSKCRVTLSEDLLTDDFFLTPPPKEKDRLLMLVNNHVANIEDLEKIVLILDYGITSDAIIQAVKTIYPYSCYTNECR